MYGVYLMPMYDDEQLEHLRKEREQMIEENKNTVTTLRVKKNTRDRLSKLCTKDQSFNQAIIMLLDFYENNSESDKDGK